MISAIFPSIVLVSLPVTLSLQCYKCADMRHFPEIAKELDDDGSLAEELEDLPALLDNPVARLAMPPCTDFNTEEDWYRMECPEGTQGCAKTIAGPATMRFCLEKINKPGCVSLDDSTVCYCVGDLCNATGETVPTMSVVTLAAFLIALMHQM